jgi:hypothetical protein
MGYQSKFLWFVREIVLEDYFPHRSAPIMGNILAAQGEMPEREEAPAQEEGGKSQAG